MANRPPIIQAAAMHSLGLLNTNMTNIAALAVGATGATAPYFSVPVSLAGGLVQAGAGVPSPTPPPSLLQLTSSIADSREGVPSQANS